MIRRVDEWGVGCYEDTAAQLAPASEAAVAALDLGGGEQVLDVACGTGNAALLARRAGAVVTGLDASPRLLEVARERVPAAEFVLGDAARLPFDDRRFDAAMSVFGLIFARPGHAAAAEIARVVRPGGRVAITTWPPRGPMFAAVALMRQSLSRRRPPDRSPAASWGSPAALESLFGPYGELEVTEHELAHEDATPEEVWDRWERLHPMWIAARAELEPAGEWQGLRAASLAALEQSAMGAGAKSPFLLAVLERT